jgi:hypothetical protein
MRCATGLVRRLERHRDDATQTTAPASLLGMFHMLEQPNRPQGLDCTWPWFAGSVLKTAQLFASCLASVPTKRQARVTPRERSSSRMSGTSRTRTMRWRNSGIRISGIYHSQARLAIRMCYIFLFCPFSYVHSVNCVAGTRQT